ncbi:histidine phosphatase family protein [Alkalicoccus daliensis]|uniref:Alpha-ribazole phosphatase n=1 Tax=Alkalicoccus daliensis TaxID=745820 RepID=A0A1H0HZ99_9BACI|nr:histidine phosphatase family protein [Alkalicoccus daliensis]SDO24474.1 alpha-ribazole phosphatase [Alkalicoccus daliensis]
MDTRQYLDFYLIRHGITKANQEKRYVGWTDVSLLQEEIGQLTHLKTVLENQPWLQVYTSDLKRCTETLSFLGIKGNKDSRLREANFGGWEMSTYDDLKEKIHYRNWLDCPFEVTPPGGESYMDFQKRVREWLEERLASVSSGAVLAVTHGGVIRQLLLELGAAASFWEAKVPHGKALIVRMVKYKEGWQCMSLSEVPSQENEHI